MKQGLPRDSLLYKYITLYCTNNCKKFIPRQVSDLNYDIFESVKYIKHLKKSHSYKVEILVSGLLYCKTRSGLTIRKPERNLNYESG